MRKDFSDAELEHLIRDPTTFIESLKRFIHKKKHEDSFSLEVENALHSIKEQIETLLRI